MPVPPSSTTPIFGVNFLKDWGSLCLSSIAIIWGFFIYRLASKNTIKNLELQAGLENLNHQRHWRRENVYKIADELYDLATDYWLTSENNLNSKKIELAIKVRLQDIEDNAIAINVDITNEVKSLMHHITGGDFENPDRQALPTSHEKFLHIRQATQKIKSKLQ